MNLTYVIFTHIFCVLTLFLAFYPLGFIVLMESQTGYCTKINFYTYGNIPSGANWMQITCQNEGIGKKQHRKMQ